MARVLLGVTGGIAAYKAAELARLLVKAGHEVTPILTPDAETFVSAKTFEGLARNEMPRELFPHLTRADLLVIAPLSANTLAKLAHGLADNVLTQTALAFEGPIVAAPAMNPRMWQNAATQANVAVLRDRGLELVGPDEGETAEGELGVGRMSEPEEILASSEELLAKRDQLRGRRVVVSAGGTREPLDAVRFLGNRSSGRMGVALAVEAWRRGAEVTLVAANLAVPAPPGVYVVETRTAADVAREMLSRDADVVLMAAAVADYRPANPTEAKRPKDGNEWTVTLEPTTDVLRELGSRRQNGQLIVGFAADVGERGLERARNKLAAKGADLIVFNDISRGDVAFDALDNEVVLLDGQEERRLPKAPKERIAAAILDEVVQRLGDGRAGRR
ncbi:MAG: bifunctional phosphopantothenoylcysteine decarboxylase/phosphopantothenate--cysteine ligase CoaBC [Gaiellaceae bacterium]